MKNLIIILAITLLAGTINAQCLADMTGETKSLYNAVCIWNDIKPGSINMTEGRKLMQEYAESIGLKYELYEFNGGNNLYILYYDANLSKMDENTSKTDDNELVVPMVGNVNLTLQINDLMFDSVNLTAMFNQDMQDEIQSIELVQLDVINADVIEDTMLNKLYAVIDYSSLFGVTCNCQDLNSSELNQYYTDLLKKSRRAKGLEKDKIDACRYQLRKYKKVVEQQEQQNGKISKKDNQIEEGYTFKQVLPDYKMGDIKTTAGFARTVSSKPKVRKLGKGHARSKNTSFWVKLFPFANC